MLFNSLHFLFFFVLVTLLYFSVPGRAKIALLLVASCYFYAAFIPVYLLILFVVIVIDYVAGIWIERSSGHQRKVLLVVSLLSNVLLLAFFKYYDFANNNLTLLLQNFGWENHIPPLDVLAPGFVLPIGLSFHTFQSMSYTIEVYRGNQRAEYNLATYSLFVLFYPQLVAGPIERPQNMLPQLKKDHRFDWELMRSGLMMMAGGMFKKVVIADRLALVVDPAFADVSRASAGELALAVFFYSIQIYCDFSGYSDIAIGAGRVMGIHMMENFRMPYLASSVTDFWRRWHISLSSWFRDYVYIPLGGNRGSVARTYLNTLTVFGLSGLWHGADWKFVVWGLLHGVYLIVEQIYRTYFAKRQSVGRPAPQLQVKGISIAWASQLITFTLVSFAWIFFRAKSLSDAVEVINRIGSFSFGQPVDMKNGELLFCSFLIGLLLLEPLWSTWVKQVSNRAFWMIFPLLVAVCYLFGVFTSNQFIYFQF